MRAGCPKNGNTTSLFRRSDSGALRRGSITRARPKFWDTSVPPTVAYPGRARAVRCRQSSNFWAPRRRTSKLEDLPSQPAARFLVSHERQFLNFHAFINF